MFKSMQFVLVFIASMAVCAMAACGEPLSKRMRDGKRWTVRNLDLKIEGSYCYEGNCRQYGRLYTWDAARSACESFGQAWRLPTDEDWRHLAALYGGGGGDEPRTRIFWGAGLRPRLERRGKCLMHGLLGEIEIAEETHERSENRARFQPVKGLNRPAEFFGRTQRHLSQASKRNG